MVNLKGCGEGRGSCSPVVGLVTFFNCRKLLKIYKKMEGCNESFCVLNPPHPQPQPPEQPVLLQVSNTHCFPLYFEGRSRHHIVFIGLCFSVYLSKTDSLKKTKTTNNHETSLKVQVRCAPSAAGRVQSRS